MSAEPWSQLTPFPAEQQTRKEERASTLPVSPLCTTAIVSLFEFGARRFADVTCQSGPVKRSSRRGKAGRTNGWLLSGIRLCLATCKESGLLELEEEVCPQFETTKSLVLSVCQKKKRGSHKPQNQDAKYGLLHAEGACQRALACKFPPLIFENSEVCAVQSADALSHSRKNTEHSHSQHKKGTAAKANIQVNGSENCSETPSLLVSQPVEPEVFSALDTGTPQLPCVRNWKCSSTQPQTSSHAELVSGVNPSGRGQLAATLVMDTPEREYGMVTWRHRPHLLKYLRDRGKLSTADIPVKADLEL
ncbi:RAD9, HUS1, RAD1-interacting nuclear orphan protein 1 [Numida meleagris]|uniref:RAD9, HUS1, RAD1-interacting nuclear orphan protein 1 n=1 Tax=Numida meleagris TaxID=8996 RepID=UPI000B3DA10A|nr:RAD9, HUS1, RAD1-interacting nuclear orphan protein 1 [Numida meleagris]